MIISSALQISLVSEREWSSLFSRCELLQRRFMIGKARSSVFTLLGDVSSWNVLRRTSDALGHASSLTMLRRMSDVSELSFVGDTFSPPEMTIWDTLHTKLKDD